MPPQDPKVAQGQWKGHSSRFRRDRLIVSVISSDVHATLDSIVQQMETDFSITAKYVNPKSRPWAIFVFAAHPQAETKIPDVAGTLALRSDVLYAEPDFEGSGHLQPQDDYYGDQQSWTVPIGLETAWDKGQGSSEVLLAVLDSGIPISAGATDPDNIELDGSRFIVRHTLSGDDIYHDYAAGDSDTTVVRDDNPADEHGHGTHITGIIAAQASTTVGIDTDGIAGINWVSKVYIARVLDENNKTYASWVKLAVDDLAKYVDGKYTRVIVNLSLGVTDHADSMKQMCMETDTGVFLLCVGPGLLASDTIGLDYPGAFANDFGHVLAVGVVQDGVIKGPHVDDYGDLTLFAPGMDIISVAPDYPCTQWGDPATAPGWVPYPYWSGPSQAAAIVSGVASLLWGANLKFTAYNIKECLLHTADAFTDGSFDGKSVNAYNAVKNAAWAVTLDDPHLTFVDVAAGEVRAQTLSFTIASCTTLTFELVDGSDAGLPASLAITGRTALYDPDAGGTTLAGIEVQYTGGAAGAVAFGTFQVTCVETGDVWTVYLTGNTESPVRSAVVLVADKSGSMALASGIGTLTRMEVLQYSADILVDTMRVSDGLGVVSFEDDASLLVGMTDITSEATNSAERIALRNAIATLTPGASTSIGDGALLGNTTVAGAAQAQKALIVLTDGYENTPAYIADVMGSITSTVYAIGMGTASAIQPTALAALTASTGGYVNLTDTMDDSTRYRIAKYFVQMLGNVTGSSLVLDPGGYIRPGMVIEIPFVICDEDREFTAILMMEASAYATYEIVTPAGTVVTTAASPGARYSPGRHSSCWRVRLPLGRGHSAAHAGTWLARFSIDSDKLERFRMELPGPAPALARGERYEFVVASESSLQLTTRVDATGHTIGSTVTMNAVLTSLGLPFDGASVSATVQWPDGSKRDHVLQSIGRGSYNASFVASQEGVYQCRIRARGYTSRGEEFTREQTMTAHIWRWDIVGDVERVRALEAEPRSLQP